MDNSTQNNQAQAAQQTQASQGNSPQPLDDGYLVSQMVDPAKISQEQLANDLEMLKQAEIVPEVDKSQEIIRKINDGEKSQELAALELANPFKGE